MPLCSSRKSSPVQVQSRAASARSWEKNLSGLDIWTLRNNTRIGDGSDQWRLWLHLHYSVWLTHDVVYIVDITHILLVLKILSTWWHTPLKTWSQKFHSANIKTHDSFLFFLGDLFPLQFGLGHCCWWVLSLSVGQELTWEVHLCPAPGAVCLASAVWVRRHHRHAQTTLHCGWLCLCPCYSPQFSPAVGRGGSDECKLCEDCKYSLYRLNIHSDVHLVRQTHVFNVALHSIGISRWEVS